ncbi:MAG: sugar transferase [candidate division Zixibacteria bacterium]
MKRFFDFVVSLSGLLVLSPLLILISLAILFSMGWPIFYRQVRVGKNGRKFKIIKFRSMVKNAEKRGPEFTTGGDSRITPLGGILRKTKLDELPQFMNVLIGDMSLVGPRPEVPRYVALYNEEQKQVLSVRPGLTDPASIAYRNEEEILAGYEDSEKAYIEEIMPAKLELNLEYINRVCFTTDISLIFKTISKIFSR